MVDGDLLRLQLLVMRHRTVQVEEHPCAAERVTERRLLHRFQHLRD